MENREVKRSPASAGLEVQDKIPPKVRECLECHNGKQVLCLYAGGMLWLCVEHFHKNMERLSFEGRVPMDTSHSAQPSDSKTQVQELKHLESRVHPVHSVNPVHMTQVQEKELNYLELEVRYFAGTAASIRLRLDKSLLPCSVWDAIHRSRLAQDPSTSIKLERGKLWKCGPAWEPSRWIKSSGLKEPEVKPESVPDGWALVLEFEDLSVVYRLAGKELG